MTRLRRRGRTLDRQRRVGDLQGFSVELALAAPFLSLRDLARWRGRLGTWHRRAVEEAALLGRLDAILARYTAARDDGATRVSA